MSESMTDQVKEKKPAKGKWFRWARLFMRWVVDLLEVWAEAKDRAEPQPAVTPADGRPAPQDDLFLPEERLIYRYYTGTADGQAVIRAVDPLPLWKKVMAKGPAIAINLKVSESVSKDAAEKHGELMRDLRDIFGVAPYEEGGLTEGELKRLLDHFLSFVNAQKKSGSSPATSPGVTGSSTPPTSPHAGSPSQPTPPGSGSGSTASGSSTAPPAPSPSV